MCVKDLFFHVSLSRPQLGAHGWDRAAQAQVSAYQHNMQRGRGGAGGFQPHMQRRDDHQPQGVRLYLFDCSL